MNFLIALLIILAIIVVGPVLMIWALNTLFALAIPYTIWTWLAVLILGSAIKANAQVSAS